MPDSDFDFDINIEKDVPLPSKFHATARWLHLADELKVGDSFAVLDAALKERVRCSLKRYGVKLATRAIKDESNKVVGYRLWCVSKPDTISNS